MSPTFRDTLTVGDPQRVESLVRATGFFSDAEIAIARELADDRLAGGDASDYRFVLAFEQESLAGFTSFGSIPGTASSWDLYWIAVAPEHQQHGIGSVLLQRSEQAIRMAGGTRVYAETSSRLQYEPTRAFYRRNGYSVAADMPDFYAPGDGKIVYLKVI